MTDKEPSKPETKRSRRRLYESPDAAAPEVEEVSQATAVPADADADAEAVEVEYPLMAPRFESRQKEALKLVNRYVRYAVGGGLIPLPVVDLVAVTSIQVKVLKELSTLYEVPFSESGSKSIIAVLAGGLGIAQLAKYAFIAGLKIVPGVGALVGVASYSAMSGAFTYALGKVFIKHYELGGTLLDFDPEKTKEYFAEQFRRGQAVAAKEL